MSRLAAVEKLLYYPTPPSQIEKYMVQALGTKSSFRFNGPWRDGTVRIIDPCGGEGIALDKVSQYVTAGNSNVEKYLVELDAGRAQKARETHPDWHVFEGDFGNWNITGDFNFVFMNPPYDTVGGARLEIKWLRMVAPLVHSKGLLMAVLPEKVINQRLLLTAESLDLYPHYHTLRFDEEHYPTFKQCIMLFGRDRWKGQKYDFDPRRTVDDTISSQTDSYISYGWIKKPEFEWIDIANEPSIFEQDELPNDLIEFLGTPHQVTDASAIMEMREEISAGLVAAGVFTGMQIGNTVVRGSITQEVTVNRYTDQTGKEVREEVPTQVALLHVLSLETGKIETINSSKNPDEFNAMIEQNAVVFTDAVREQYPALLTEDFIAEVQPQLDRVRSPRKIEGSDLDGLLGAQNERAAGILKGWKRNKTVVVAGEMGVGKTVTSLAAAVVEATRRGNLRKQKIIILVPAKNDLVEKWAEEIMTSLREFKPKMFKWLNKNSKTKYHYDCQTISEVQEAMSHEGFTVILIKESMLKRSSGWDNLPRFNRVNPSDNRRKCPTCGAKTVMLKYGTEEDPVEKEDSEKGHCPRCKSQLWTEKRDHNNNAYSPLSRYIRQHYSGGYVLIIDEAHGYKGGDTARAYASADLIVGAKRVLMMTGTLYNGMASSIFYLLYRTNPLFRSIYRHTDRQLFVKTYGLEKRVEKWGGSNGNNSRSSSYGYRKSTSISVQEIPGIHPLMLLWLVPNTIYFKLDDLDIALPPKFEHTLFVDGLAEPYKATKNYLDRMYTEAVQKATDWENRDTSLLASHTWARTGAFDMAPIGDKVQNHNLPPQRPEVMHPKEDALVRLCIKHVQQGERVLVYYDQIDRRPIQERLIKHLSKYNVNAVFMGANVSNRVKFVKDAIKGGADVVITNPALVREGIDLIMFKAIIWYGTTFDANLAQQANRRIYRIGQTSTTHVYYLAYNSTPQADTFVRLAKKIQAAQTAHGDLRHGIATILGEETLVDRIQKGVIESTPQESSMMLEELPEPKPLIIVGKEKKEDAKPIQERKTISKVSIPDIKPAEVKQLSLWG